MKNQYDQKDNFFFKQFLDAGGRLPEEKLKKLNTFKKKEYTNMVIQVDKETTLSVTKTLQKADKVHDELAATIY